MDRDPPHPPDVLGEHVASFWSCDSGFPQIKRGTSSPPSDSSFFSEMGPNWSQTGAAAALDSEQLLVLDPVGPD